jgi:hypothetical protein
VDGKPYRQLLAFTLTGLRALNALAVDPLADLVEEQLPVDVRDVLERHRCLAGAPGSGNQAMFLAIFLLHAGEALGIDTRARVDAWVELHLSRMNRFGFWGSDRGMTHLQFQNGYHQYEILEYLNVRNPRGEAAVRAVRSLADRHGHFAPYPGGGGCYDYDAAFVLTPRGELPDVETGTTLCRTATSLLDEQQPDGGFAESLRVRPRSTSNLGAFASHAVRGAPNPRLLLERTRYALALQRPAHDRIHTHWSDYSRKWSESNLWDSWFRMMTLARIQIALGVTPSAPWGFVDFPGIGFHPVVRRSATAS